MSENLILVASLISERRLRVDVDGDAPMDFELNGAMDFDAGGDFPITFGELVMAESQSSLVAESAHKIRKANKQVESISPSTN